MVTIPSTTVLLKFLQQNTPDSEDLQQRLNSALKKPLLPERCSQVIRLYEKILSEIETWLHQDLLKPDRLNLYQEVHQELEGWQQTMPQDHRHHFTIVIPVADRPQQLQNCLNSLLTLCSYYPYSRASDGRYQKISLLIVDDSNSTESKQAIETLCGKIEQQGIQTLYFGQKQQQATVDKIPAAQRSALQQTIGSSPVGGHKGASITRNIALLKLMELQQITRHKSLFWFIDSDQEFQVSTIQKGQERTLYCIHYLYQLDQIFHSPKQPVMVTGKLVGDPPVSPTVMANNLLQDIRHFLSTLTNLPPDQPCQFHTHQQRREGEAAYHDMTDLFGYPPPDHPYQYNCNLEGKHNHHHCLQRFAQRINHFFYGEHPTRYSYYKPSIASDDLKPARTVYTANYVVTAEGLGAFIPFAALKLRMAGPALGRFLQQQLGDRFLSTNLPMLHKRTLDHIGEAEHRAGVVGGSKTAHPDSVDLSGEFERQFYGDVLLFSLRVLQESGFPQQTPPMQNLLETLQQTEHKLRQRYLQSRSDIETQLKQLSDEALKQTTWWQQNSDDSVRMVEQFINTVRDNFLEGTPAWNQIESSTHRQHRLHQIAEALSHYRDEQFLWDQLIENIS